MLKISSTFEIWLGNVEVKFDSLHITSQLVDKLYFECKETKKIYYLE